MILDPCMTGLEKLERKKNDKKKNTSRGAQPATRRMSADKIQEDKLDNVLIGFCNPLLDISADVEKEFVEKFGLKVGSTIMVQKLFLFSQTKNYLMSQTQLSFTKKSKKG